jgi:hypothetical protein
MVVTIAIVVLLIDITIKLAMVAIVILACADKKSGRDEKRQDEDQG